MVWAVNVARMQQMAWNTVYIIVNNVIASPSSSYWLQKQQQPSLHICVCVHTALFLCLHCEREFAVRYVSGDMCVLDGPNYNTDPTLRILFLRLQTIRDQYPVNPCRFVTLHLT
jgi:hypothetical protein